MSECSTVTVGTWARLINVLLVLKCVKICSYLYKNAKTSLSVYVSQHALTQILFLIDEIKL
jgi:hypothetical protein